MLGSSIGFARDEWTDDLAGLSSQEQMFRLRAQAAADGDDLDKPGVLLALEMFRSWDELAGPGSSVEVTYLNDDEPDSLRDVLASCVADGEPQRIPRAVGRQAYDLAARRHTARQHGKVTPLFTSQDA